MIFHSFIADSNFVHFRTTTSSMTYSILKCVISLSVCLFFIFFNFFFSDLKFECFCCTLFGRHYNCQGVTHKCFLCQHVVILVSLEGRTLHSYCMNIGFKSKFHSHWIFKMSRTKCFARKVLSLNKLCNIQCSNNWYNYCCTCHELCLYKYSFVDISVLYFVVHFDLWWSEIVMIDWVFYA